MRRTTLGTYIRSLRIKKGMTQAQLAELLNVTDKAVSKWERDLSYPDITILPKLADVLGIRVSSIIDESIGEGSSSGLIRLFEMSHDIRTPLHIIIGCADIASNHLGDDNKELLIKYLRSIRTSGVYLLDVLDKFMREQEAETTDVCFDKNEKSSDNEEPASPVSPDFAGKLLLVVEDMQINQEIVAEILKQTGAMVELVGDGRKCLDRIMEKEPGYYDMILMDILMPEMDGIEATKKIRQLADSVKASIPIIAVTANAREKDRIIALGAGMDGFVEKPIFPEKLFETMQKIFDQKDDSEER